MEMASATIERPLASGLLLAEISPSLLFVAGLLLVVVMTARWRRRRRRTESSAAGVLDRVESGAPFRPESQSAWEVQMLDMSRDMLGELNTKIRIVEQLTLRAEQQATRLEALVDRAERLSELLDSQRGQEIG